MRIGVHTGPVLAAAGGSSQAFVTGDTVNTAARLEQGAEPGEILIGPMTEELVRDAVVAEPHPVRLRGKQGAIPAFRLLAVTGGERHSRRLAAPIVGRNDELLALREAFIQAVGGKACQLVTVLASAGVGKSRLVAEFQAVTHEEARFVRGRCLAYGEGITYWALGEILRDAAGVEETSEPDRIRQALADLVDGDPDRDRVTDLLAAVLGASSTQTSADDLAWATRRLFAHLAMGRPLIAIFEDIHWAEPTLLDLIETLVDWGEGRPILVLCTARPDLVEHRPEWGTRRLNANVLRLEPLGAIAAERLIDGLPGGSALPARVRERVAAASDGKPLFVEEMLGKLADDGLLSWDGERWVASEGIAEVVTPASISALIAARLDGLPAPEQAAAERASVVGRVFESGAVVALSPALEREAIDTQLSGLARKDVIRPAGTGLDGYQAFTFRHILIRDAAYERLTKRERADLHEHFAEWLERVVGERLAEYLDIAAHHRARALEYRIELGHDLTRSDEVRLALQRLAEAADRAKQLHAYRDEARLHERALHILDRLPVTFAASGHTGVDLMRRAAEARYLAGDYAEAIASIEAALARLPADASIVQALLLERLATYRFEQDGDPAALKAGEEATRLVPAEPPSRDRARVLASYARLLMLDNKYEPAIALCRAAMESTEAIDAPIERGSAMNTLGMCLSNTGHAQEGVALLEAALTLAEEAGDGYGLGRAFVNLSIALGNARLIDRQREVVRRGIEELPALGLERSIGIPLLINAASNDCWAGRLSEAEVLVGRALALEPTGNMLAFAWNVAAVEKMWMGDFEAAGSAFARARAAATRRPRSPTLSDIAHREAEFAVLSGHWDRGRRLAAEAKRLVPDGDLDLLVWIELTLVQAESGRALEARSRGDESVTKRAVRAARRSAKRARSLREEAQNGMARLTWDGEASLVLLDGELARAEGRPDPAAWRRAIERLAEGSLGWLEAYARVRLVEALLESGAAGDVITEALVAARDAGTRSEARGLLRMIEGLEASFAQKVTMA
jgi:tetratricopeptide (TPR) repeat protein